MTNIRLGIVGCGLTGVVTALLLKMRLPQISVTILEKSKATGGRMCTSRNSHGIPVDLGAQFITKSKVLTPVQENCYTDLINKGVLLPLQQAIDGLRTMSSTVGNFVAPKGSGSIVKHFLQQSGCEILFQHRVTKINSFNQKWLMEYENGSNHEFDAVVLTMPVPQILQLDGLSSLLKEHYDNLEAVEFSSRFALGLFYDAESDFLKKIPYSVKFFSDDPVLAFFSVDNIKRSETTSPPSVVIHTTKEFGKSHIDKDSHMVKDLIMDHVTKLLPGLPKPSEIKSHKWRYSQVVNNFKGKGSLELSKSPLLICGGDGFTHSTFEGCILSAESIVNDIENNLIL